MAKGRGDRFAEIEDRYAGYTVYDRHYEKIGKVDDLFVDGNDEPEYIGVKMGFLGTRSTLIPVELARVNERRQLIEVAADKGAIERGPTFDDDRDITAEFERQVLSHYGLESASTSAGRGAYSAYYSDATGGEQVDLQPGRRAEETHERSGRERTGTTTGGVDRERSRSPRDENELRVQRSEEELRAGVREREAGTVNVRKRVRVDHEQIRVPRRREEVSVERVPVQEERRTTESEIGEDEVVVPIVEEEIVVEKRPVVKEEIRLRKDVVEDEEIVEADLRKEEVDIEDTSGRRKPRGNR